MAHFQLPGQVLLTQSDFVHVYQPRNIYFFDPAEQTLVPDPVYVPEEATPADLVKQLVRVVMAPPSGWLRNAVQTAFPAGTKLLTVSLDGGTAVVNLGGAVTRSSEDALHQMSAQLLWTLTGSSSDEPTIQSVELEIKGTPWNAGQDSPVQQLSSYDSYVPSAPGHASFYYTDSHGAVRSLSGSAQANAPQGALVAGQAGSGDIPLTQVAVSPDGRYVAGVGTGGSLYTGALTSKSTLTLRVNGRFTSLSWDIHGNLWAVQDGQIWMIPGHGGSALPGHRHAAGGGEGDRAEGRPGRGALRPARLRPERHPAAAGRDRRFREAGSPRSGRADQPATTSTSRRWPGTTRTT